jgi:RNA polymerase subunit RPABC4/transcription elongation factor Spt4
MLEADDATCPYCLDEDADIEEMVARLCPECGSASTTFLGGVE